MIGADGVLAALAEAMQAALRGRNIAGRLGGDEFCMLRVQVSAEAPQRAEALRRVVAAHGVHTERARAAVALSIGIPRPGEDRDAGLDRLPAIADRCLDPAQRTGRERVVN